MSTISGSCLCGAVRYRCAAPAVLSGNCHCRDCQRSSGSAYAPTFFVPQQALEISGEVRYYGSPGSSGRIVRRGFCPSCGSQLFGIAEAMPGLVGVRAGTLDDASQYVPHVDIFVGQAAPWDHLPEGAVRFDAAPPR